MAKAVKRKVGRQRSPILTISDLASGIPVEEWRKLYGGNPNAQQVPKEATKSPKEITDERGKTHGDFQDHARATQRLKTVIADELRMRDERGQVGLTHRQKEFLDMVMHKVGRILAGDANFADHYDDIAGYAYIAIDR